MRRETLIKLICVVQSFHTQQKIDSLNIAAFVVHHFILYYMLAVIVVVLVVDEMCCFYAYKYGLKDACQT